MAHDGGGAEREEKRPRSGFGCVIHCAIATSTPAGPSLSIGSKDSVRVRPQCSYIFKFGQLCLMGTQIWCTFVLLFLRIEFKWRDIPHQLFCAFASNHKQFDIINSTRTMQSSTFRICTDLFDVARTLPSNRARSVRRTALVALLPARCFQLFVLLL